MKYLLVYKSTWDLISKMTDEEAGQFAKALGSYCNEEPVELEDRYLLGIYQGIEPNLNIIRDNYYKKIKANQENGKKGGAPKKKDKPTSSEITQSVFDNPIEPDDNSTEPDEITFGDPKPIIKKRHSVDEERYDRLKQTMEYLERPYTLENMLKAVTAETEKDDVKRIYNERHLITDK